MKRKLFPVLLLAIGASSNSLAGSFFENQLRQIINVTKKSGEGADSNPKTQPIENSSRSRGVPPATLTNTDGGTPAPVEVMSKEEYCQKVSKNATIRKYINFAKTYQHPNQLTGFLDPDNILAPWVFQRVEESGGEFRKGISKPHLPRWPLGEEIRKIFAQCAIDSVDGDDFLFYAAHATSYIDNVRQEIKARVERYTPRQEKKVKIDAQGNIVADEQVPPKVNLDALYNQVNDVLRSNAYSGVDEFTAVVYALALPNGEKAIDAAAQGAFGNMTKLLAHQEAQQKAIAKEEAVKAKEDEKNGEELAKYFAYLATNEGKLFTGYKYTQLIEACRKAREGMAAVYVSSSESEAVKAKIRRIESVLMPTIREKSDKVWNDAILSNRGNTPFNGVDMLEWIKTAKFQEGSRACDSFKVEFQKNALSVLGPDEVKKNF
ncbi:hypothetical protein [Aquabacterium sp.]|uniref:hypothetical protein n=1 Tax=Aquabacterium sp. TaxID=1872578 RepID=UPI00403836AF